MGTAIIAAIAIIFLPDILDGEKKTYQEEFAKIPEAPKVDFESTGKRLNEDKLSQLSQETLSDEQALDDDVNDKKSTANDDNTVKVTSLPTSEANLAVSNNTKKEITKEKELASVIADAKPKKLPEKAVLKEAWVIQLGSFRHKKNVDELIKKLKDKGYTVFSNPIKTRTGNLTKVFVGPELIKSSLEKKIPALKTLTSVEGKIARFKPTK